MRPNPTSVGAVDVQYDDQGNAVAALIVCSDLTFGTARSEHVAEITGVVPYEAGALFKRELPCILAVMALAPPLQLLVIDGYATLDPAGRPGLGAYAAAATGIPVIGIAKTRFQTATHAAQVSRGGTRALYVTVAGEIDVAVAVRIVSGMEGAHRLPTALIRVDRLARGRVQPIFD